MRAVDTSWLYALFHADDEHHRRAFAEAQDVEPMLINPIILVEFLDLVRRRRGDEASREAQDDLLKLPHARLVAAPKPAGMARVMERNSGLSWFDAAAICTALDEGAGLRTFDAAQRKAFDAMA